MVHLTGAIDDEIAALEQLGGSGLHREASLSLTMRTASARFER
jgi:hypothetical protein